MLDQKQGKQQFYNKLLQICPVCRKDIRNLKVNPSRLIDYSVKIMMQYRKLENKMDEYNRFKERVKNYQSWKDKHILSSDLKAGDKIDVRDTQYIWCVAHI